MSALLRALGRPSLACRAPVLAAALLIPALDTAFGEDVSSPPPSLGERVYNRHCALCHGLGGDGRGVAASLFVFEPRDFTKGVYKLRSTASGRLPTDEDLKRSVLRGLPGTAMVAQDHLTSEEIAAVVAYVKSFSDRFDGKAAPKALKLPDESPRAEATLSRGREVYVEAGCPECHGASGEGDGPAAASLSLPPTDLTRRPLKSGPAPRDILRTIVTGLDGTPMPSFHLMFDDADMWALAYYVESLGEEPRMTADEAVGWGVEGRESKTRRSSRR